jgi:transposase InsO family protein
VLTDAGTQIARSTDHAARARSPSPRAVGHQALTAAIERVHADYYGVYGARKVWRPLHRESTPVARCTVERLRRRAGLAGAVRGKTRRATVLETTYTGPLTCWDAWVAAPEHVILRPRRCHAVLTPKASYGTPTAGLTPRRGAGP